MATKTLIQKREAIESKINLVNRLKEEKSALLDQVFDECGNYDHSILAKVLGKDKELHCAQGVAKRMIKRIVNDLYNGWSYSDNEYSTILDTYKKFVQQ